MSHGTEQVVSSQRTRTAVRTGDGAVGEMQIHNDLECHFFSPSWQKLRHGAICSISEAVKQQGCV